MSVGGSEGDHFAAMRSRAGSEIDHVVGATNRLFVVLNDKNCIAEVAQLAESFEQSLIVARMKPD